jgi:hypothetical protein
MDGDTGQREEIRFDICLQGRPLQDGYTLLRARVPSSQEVGRRTQRRRRHLQIELEGELWS